MKGADQIAQFLRGAPSGSVIAVLGAPGTGKSRAVQAADERGAFRRRVVFDPYAWTDVQALTRGAAAWPWPGELITPEDLARSPDLLDRSDRLVVAPRTMEPRRLGRQFAIVADLVWYTGGVDVIAEEAALYSRAAVDHVLRLSSGGRHVGSRLILIAQSLTRLTIDARRHISHLLVFAQGEPVDLRELAARCGGPFAERVRALRRGTGEFLMWTQGDALLDEEDEG